MLNRCYLLVPAHDGMNPVATGEITVAHIVDCQAGGGAAADCRSLMSHQYGSHGNYPFCLALRGTDNDVATKIQELLLLFFHPWYEYAEEGKTLFVYGPAGQQMAASEQLAVRERLAGIFRQQGLDVAVHFPGEERDFYFPVHVADLPPVQHSLRTWTCSGSDLAACYGQYCLTFYSPEDIFLVDNAGDTIPALQAAEADLKANHPVFYRLAAEVRQARQTIARLGRDKAQLEEENIIRQQLLEISSKHDEVDYILRFYKNEYEILPLWYKRLGHIIKVLQGKRNFRSLYDDNVEKYKE